MELKENVDYFFVGIKPFEISAYSLTKKVNNFKILR